MNFDDLKVTWNSQSEEHLYVLNEEGLRSEIRAKTKEFKRLVSWQVVQTYGSSLFILGMISILLIAYVTGFLDGQATLLDAGALLVAASGCGCGLAALYTWVIRSRRCVRRALARHCGMSSIARASERGSIDLSSTGSAS